MESSTVLAFRIFVMLSCLIIVPMAAIFGSAFPDVVKTVLVDRIVALSTGKPVESKGQPAAVQPDGFREVTSGAAQPPANSQPGGEAPRWGTPQAEPASWQPQGPAAGNSAVVPVGGAGPRAGFNQSASFSTPSDPGSPYQSAQHLKADAAAGRGAAGANIAIEPHRAADSSAAGAAGPERFTEMERKLRELGATYYLLETWGSDGQLYRFHCRMPVGENPNYTRHFEATGADAMKAMAEVLERVGAWRAGRLQ
jgi:hypothetical protein